LGIFFLCWFFAVLWAAFRVMAIFLDVLKAIDCE
jgi:hypothetical protein